LEKHHPRAYKKSHNHKLCFLFKTTIDNLQRGVKEELYRPDINVDIIAKYRIESTFMAFNSDVFSHSKYRVTDVLFEMNNLFLHGITTLKGRKLVEKYMQKTVLKK
jgi:hypothetical protein